jgi:hypothetical protein
MKKLVLLGFLALSFLAMAKPVSEKSSFPLPGCDPCPWVR